MKKSFVLILLTTIIIALMSYNHTVNKKKQLTVQVISPQIRDISDYINVNGKIKEGNKRSIYVDGINKITKINVEPGMKVSAGDTLVEVKNISISDLKAEDFLPDNTGIEAVFDEYGIDIDLLNSYTVKTNHSSNNTLIKSPIDGIVTDINIHEGDVVTPINRLISVSDLNDLYVEALIPEQYSSKILENASVQISANSLDESVYKGKIKTISPIATYIPSITGEGKTYIKSTIQIKEIDRKMRPGLNVTTRIQVDKIENAITLPYECILQDELNREYVYCLKNSGSIKRKYIKTGYELDEYTEIRSGINSEDRIILNPTDGLNETIKVKELEIK